MTTFRFNYDIISKKKAGNIWGENAFLWQYARFLTNGLRKIDRVSSFKENSFSTSTLKYILF